MNGRNMLDFIQKAGRLKNVHRAGWRMRGIQECESVADHTWGTALLCMTLADALRDQGIPIDTERVLRIALIHDVGEAVIGDIPQPADSPVSRETKSAIEGAAVDQITGALGDRKDAYWDLWEEYESADTIEARLVRAADKLEMLIQAAEYERIGYRCLDEFWLHDGNRPFFDEFPPVAELMQQLERARLARGER